MSQPFWCNSCALGICNAANMLEPPDVGAMVAGCVVLPDIVRMVADVAGSEVEGLPDVVGMVAEVANAAERPGRNNLAGTQRARDHARYMRMARRLCRSERKNFAARMCARRSTNTTLRNFELYKLLLEDK